MKKIAAITVMLFCAATAYGQTGKGGDLNRQVSVAKDYAPSVDKAAKLAITPQMNDTVTLRPDFDYIVRPKAWIQGFSVSPIRPATVDAATYDPRYPFYVKAGGGFPGQTLFDFYANTTGKGRSSLGFYLNHYAQFADIDVKERGKTDAKSTRNSTGIFGTTGFGRYALSGEIGWDYDVVTLYGDFNDINYFEIGQMQHYSVPRARVVFGNDFTDLSYFNFRLGADGYLLDDRYDNKESGVGAFVEAGKRFGLHNITLKADFESYKGGGQREGVDNTIVRVGPRYELRSENFLFRMGAVFAYDEASEETETYFLPQVELRLSTWGGAFSPYLKLNSEITANSLLRISSLNPYAVAGHAMPSMVEYNLRGGFSGSVGSVFSYNVFAGGDIVKNSPIFMRVFVTDPIMGTMMTRTIMSLESKRRVLTAGAELEAHIGGGFTVAVAGQYFKNKDGEGDEINYLPKYTASLKMTYNHRDKLLLRAGIDVRGEYEFLPNNFQGENLQAPAAVDVTMAAQYNLSPTFGIFVEGNNLANQKLYPYHFYQGVGMNVSAGVKVRF